MLTTIFAAMAALGIYWVLMGGAILLWAVWTLIRMPYDLSQDGRE